MTERAEHPHLAFFMPSFDNGGVEHMLVNLARGLGERGVTMDFLCGDPDGAYLDRLGEGCRLVTIPDTRPEAVTRWTADYLADAAPHLLMVGKPETMPMAAKARRQSGWPGVLALRAATTESARLEGRGALRRLRGLHRARRWYRMADRIVANSEGVADDVVALAGADRDTVAVIRNPVVSPEIEQRAAEPVDHPWLNDHGGPVILGAGRFGRAKDFETLIRAFARLRGRRPVRLMLLGRGRLEGALRRLATELGVADDVAFPGFVENPYAYMARARVFALSSRWEGSPNVLAEALAVGTPVVATDCRSGPREILQSGRYGPLVPVGDAEALADALANTLDQPLAPSVLREAVADYTLAASSEAYLAWARSCIAQGEH